MDIVSRIKAFMASSNISSTQFADACSIPRPTLSQILSGRNKKISDEVISKIHEAYPRLSVLWLLFGEGEMLTPANIQFSAPQNTPKYAYETEQQPASASVFGDETSDPESLFAERNTGGETLIFSDDIPESVPVETGEKKMRPRRFKFPPMAANPL